jgi:hypothetical protein
LFTDFSDARGVGGNRSLTDRGDRPGHRQALRVNDADLNAVSPKAERTDREQGDDSSYLHEQPPILAKVQT